MAIDETAQIHDGIVGSAWAQLFGRGEGVTFYVWYLPVAPVVLVGLIWLSRCVLDLDPPVRVLFVASTVIYLGGALGMALV
jgi:hypothetical protein